MKDIQGINRGKCNCCECDEYRHPPPEDSSDVQYLKLRCEYCNHTPVEHVRLIELGACMKCGADNCEEYESDEKNCYTVCGYCGCPAACHSGAEKCMLPDKLQFGLDANCLVISCCRVWVCCEF